VHGWGLMPLGSIASLSRQCSPMLSLATMATLARAAWVEIEAMTNAS
jgi:hypothetical protein